jgi:hypothetical protein
LHLSLNVPTDESNGPLHDRAVHPALRSKSKIAVVVVIAHVVVVP